MRKGLDIAKEIRLDFKSRTPLNQQLYSELCRLILSGRMSPGQRLPSTRSVAEILGVSRPTVTHAFEQLLSEGFVESRSGSGTFVKEDLPEDIHEVAPRVTRIVARDFQKRLSVFGRMMATNKFLRVEQPELEICFYGWRPCFDRFPMRDWGRILSRQGRMHRESMLDFPADPAGYLPLREAIADFLVVHRGIDCEPEQVLIVMGLQQAIDMIARLHIASGDVVAVENPSYNDARSCFIAHGATIRPIPVDEEGIDVEKLLSESSRRFKLTYVTPSHQFPTGAVLTLSRRLELLGWAKERKAIIVEDDYDSEFRYSGRPIPALKSLDDHELVVYIGSFAKMMFPSLSVGYMVLPEHLVPVYTTARMLAGEQQSLQLQAALAEFVSDGHLDRHIRRMRTVYDERRQVLVECLEEHFGENATVSGDNAGLHALVRFKSSLTDREIIHRAAEAGVGLISTNDYYVGRGKKGEFAVGFGNLEVDEIEDGISRLADVILSS